MKFIRLAAVAVASGALVGAALPAAAQNADDPVVATVNGASIHRSDVETARSQLPEQYRSLPMERLYQPLLNQLIRSKLLAQQAREEKLQETESHKRRLNLMEDRLLEEALLRRTIDEKVTEEALRARYDKTVKDFPSKDEVRARHILVKTEDEATAIIKELDGGADFAKLAGEKSIGPSKSQGGDLNYFGRGQMVKEFEEAAFALDSGSYTKQPVQTQFGWHVIKVEDKRKSEPPAFEEAQNAIGEEMSQEVAQDLVEKLTEGAKIERFELDGTAPRMKRLQPAAPAQ